MRFLFCGNIDCPEWVLAEITIINRISSSKMKEVLAQFFKKITGQQFDQEKLFKSCKSSQLNAEETRCFLSVIEFILTQASTHNVTDAAFNKDLL